MTTYTELSAIRSKYTNLTFEDLSLLPVNPPKNDKNAPKESYLRGLAALLEAGEINRDSKKVSFKSARQAELINVIWQVLEDQRVIDAAKAKELSQDSNESVEDELKRLAVELWQDIQTYIEGLRIANSDSYKDIDGGLGAISLKLVRAVETRTNGQGNPIESTTVTRYIGKIKKYLRDFNTALEGKSETTVKTYQKVLETLLGATVTYTFKDRGETVTKKKYQPGWVDQAASHHTTIKNHRSTENKQERSEDASEIKAFPLIDWAVDLLVNLNETTNANKWIDVAVAIAVLTGRRMGEVMYSGAFEQTDSSNHLIFSGQMKGKSGEPIEAFEIPILGNNPTAILNGWQWLRRNKPITNYEKERGSFSKQISREMKVYNNKLVYTRIALRDGVEQSLHFHSLRKIYAQIIGSRAGKQDRLLRIAEALGDKNDAKTASTYDSDYQVSDAAEILNIYFKN